MFFELIATVVAGFAGAGVMMLANKLLGGRFPRWVVPVAAGAAMLAAAIANEYGWYQRTSQALPDGLEVALTVNDKAIYRPWGYAFPFVSRFLAVDMATARVNESQPGRKLVDIYAFGRWAAPQKRMMVIDCEGGRRGDVPPDAQIASDGTVEGVAWYDTGRDDPIVATACREGG